MNTTQLPFTCHAIMADNGQDLGKRYGGPLKQWDHLWCRFFPHDKQLQAVVEPCGKVRIPPKDKKKHSFKSGHNLLTQGAIEKWTTFLFQSSYGTTYFWFVFVYLFLNIFFALTLVGVVIACENRGRESTAHKLESF